MENQSFKERIKSMSVKRKIVLIVMAFLLVSLPVGVVAYQINHSKNTRTASKNEKSGLNGQTINGGKAGNVTMPQSRLERFSKDRISERIKTALEANRITDAQAKALNKKLSEIDKFVSANKSKSNEEKSKAVLDKRKELSKWAKDNNIPTRYIVGWL